MHVSKAVSTRYIVSASHFRTIEILFIMDQDCGCGSPREGLIYYDSLAYLSDYVYADS